MPVMCNYGSSSQANRTRTPTSNHSTATVRRMPQRALVPDVTARAHRNRTLATRIQRGPTQESNRPHDAGCLCPTSGKHRYHHPRTLSQAATQGRGTSPVPMPTIHIARDFCESSVGSCTTSSTSMLDRATFIHPRLSSTWSSGVLFSPVTDQGLNIPIEPQSQQSIYCYTLSRRKLPIFETKPKWKLLKNLSA